MFGVARLPEVRFSSIGAESRTAMNQDSFPALQVKNAKVQTIKKNDGDNWDTNNKNRKHDDILPRRRQRACWRSYESYELWSGVLILWVPLCPHGTNDCNVRCGTSPRQQWLISIGCRLHITMWTLVSYNNRCESFFCLFCFCFCRSLMQLE